MSNKNFKKGFTLVELLVVVLIIGILAGMATVGYFTSLEASRAREATNILRHWQSARAIYFAESEDPSTVATDPSTTLTRLQMDSNITNNKYFDCEAGTSSVVCKRKNGLFSIVATDSKLYCCWGSSSSSSAEKVCRNLSNLTNVVQGETGLPANNSCLEIVE